MTNIIPFRVRGLPGQRDLFTGPSSTAPSTGVVGLVVTMVHRPCLACGSKSFIVGSSAAMHHARLTCADCEAFAGWLSKGAFTFIRMTVERFGLPTEPKTVRHSSRSI